MKMKMMFDHGVFKTCCYMKEGMMVRLGFRGLGKQKGSGILVVKDHAMKSISQISIF